MKAENIEQIKSQAPNAWADFNRFCKESYTDLFKQYPDFKVESLPFPFLLGVFHSYLLDSAGTELDLGNLSFEDLENEVVQAFIVHEVVMRHYS